MDSLAAVGVEDPAEELHAHDGEGVVEDEQGEAQAAGGADSDRGPAEPASRAARLTHGAQGERRAPARFSAWEVPAGKGPRASGLG